MGEEMKTFKEYLNEASKVTVHVMKAVGHGWSVAEHHPKKSPRGRSRFVYPEGLDFDNVEDAEAAADEHAAKNGLRREPKIKE